MSENDFFQENTAIEAAAEPGQKKPLDVPALILGILTVAAAVFIPLVSYACGIVGLVFAIKNRKRKRTVAALILCIVGIIIAVIAHVIYARYFWATLG